MAHPAIERAMLIALSKGAFARNLPASVALLSLNGAAGAEPW